MFGFGPDAGPGVNDGLQAVFDSARSGAIELLDIECVRVDEHRGPVTFPLSELPHGLSPVDHGFDLSLFDGADSGILDEEDRDMVAADLAPGGFAIAIVYEDRSLAAAAAAWAQAGGTELLSGGVDMAALAQIVGEEQEA